MRNKRGSVQRLGALLCALAMLTALVPSAFAAQPARSDNKGAQSYVDYGTTVKSYLYANGQGGVTRVEAIGGDVVVEDYDSSFRLTGARTIRAELPIWGGFYAGADCNFLIFGQTDQGESDSVEVIRVVKYSKGWERLGAASLYGANTSVPFAMGSLRCAEHGGMLYIRTCHQMYRSADGIQHQADLTFSVRERDMTITDQLSAAASVSVGYVSHSFDQYILVDQEGWIVTLDHGDAYPRGAILGRYAVKAGGDQFLDKSLKTPFQSQNICPFGGAVGSNTTGASLGGLEETSGGYVAAYAYDGKGTTQAASEREIYLAFASKEDLSSTAAKIPGTAGASTPVLASTGLDGGYVLWTKGGTLCYAAYDAQGKVGTVKTASAALSDCEPIVCGGKVVWYVTAGSAPTFYCLDSSGVSAVPAEQAAQPFTDVAEGAYYTEAVEWAVENGITTGTSPTTFSPGQDCTHAQILTFLWRAAGRPVSSAKAPVAVADAYAEAVNWAYGKGMIGGSFDPDAPCTRSEAVLYIWRDLDRPSSGTSSFSDVPADAPYANAVSWAVEAGVTDGFGGDSFAPDLTCTRGQIVTFLYRAQ